VEEAFLLPHLQEAHGLTGEEYLAVYPGSPTVANRVTTRTGIPATRTPVRDWKEAQVTFAGTSFPLHHQVPEDACLPRPLHFRPPTAGAAKAAAARLARHLRYNRHSIVWGPSGSGKDAFLSAWSWACRRPGAVFQVRPEANIEGWLRPREISPERGSYYSDGLFLKLYRDGFEVKNDKGEVTDRIPCVLLITDIDRATEEQMETFRLIMDSISGRFVGPEGVTHKMLPGTLIVASANTIGGGDDTGLYRSARPQDASMMSRWKRAVRWHYLDWKDEEAVLRAKFPGLVAREKRILSQMKSITGVIRSAIDHRRLRAVFGHREVHDIMEDAWDIIRSNSGKVPPFLLRDASLCVLERSTDEVNIKTMKDLINPHIEGDFF